MIKIFPNIEELNNFAAEKFVEIANDAINSERCSFAVVLAGGSTPKSLYKLLSSEKFKDKVDWSKVFFFFGDERNVLPDDTESNFRMTNENLFQPLKIAPENIFRWNTEEKDAEIVADDYNFDIRRFFSDDGSIILESEDQLSFDLVLLGMGVDGHTASLFPFTEALRETNLIAVANVVEKLKTIRLTLTFPIINNARNIMFLVKGADKAETLRDVLEGEFQPEKLPSQSVKPKDGNLFWLCDSESATFLKLENK